MSVKKAIKFIRQIGYDDALRAKCYDCSNREELLNMLEFSEFEFEEAINSQLVKCQTEEEAENIRQLKLWFSII